MKLFGKQIQNSYTLTSTDSEFLSSLGIDTTSISGSKLSEITFFTCLKHLSESISKLPINHYSLDDIKGKEKIKSSEILSILNIQPNPFMNATTFWSCVELNRNFHGNSYVYIERYRNAGKKNGQVKGLWVLPSSEVTVILDDVGIFGQNNSLWYMWNDSKGGKTHYFSHSEIMHFKSSISFNGIVGLSIKDIIGNAIDISQYGANYLQKFYRNGMFGGKVILQYASDFDPKKKDMLVKETEKYLQSNTGRFLPMPVGISATKMDLSLTDADMYNLSKLNALQIAACMGIKPNILNDYSNSSYSNSETQQLDYYINSFSPILKQYKEEMSRKLLFDFSKEILEHDIKALFKLDPKSQMEVLVKGMNNFMFTPNDCREELGESWFAGDNANKLYGNGNLISLDKAGEGANYPTPPNNTDQKGGE